MGAREHFECCEGIKTMTPKQILNTMLKDEIKIMHQEYLKKYPGDKQQFDEGIISSATSRRVDKFIKNYEAMKRQPQNPSTNPNGHPDKLVRPLDKYREIVVDQDEYITIKFRGDIKFATTVRMPVKELHDILMKAQK